MEDKLIFIPDVAQMLNRSPAQIRWMVANKTAPRHAKIAGRVCFKTSDVEAFIADAFAEADTQAAAVAR